MNDYQAIFNVWVYWTLHRRKYIDQLYKYETEPRHNTPI